MGTRNSNRTRFTDKQLKNLAPRAANYRQFDDATGDPDLKGFGMQVTPKGTKSFILHYTSPETRKRRIMTLGAYPSVKLVEARRMAREARALIKDGTDPQESRQRTQTAKKVEIATEEALGTVEQLFDLYIQDLAMDGKRSAVQYRYIYNRDIRDTLGHLKARDVTPDHVADVITNIAERGAITLANRTRTLMRSAFEFGINCRAIPRWRRKVPDFQIKSNPVAATRKAGQDKRGQRYLSREELRRVWFLLEEPYPMTQPRGGIRMVRPDPLTIGALRFLFSTGQRVEEVLHATWSEFDLAGKLWTIPAGRRKSRQHNPEDHLVPLTSFQVDLLEQIRPYAGSKWLFPHQDGTKPRGSDTISQALRRFCDRNGIDRFQPRDTRRTWKTLAGMAGIDLEIRNRIQGHAMRDVGSQHYDRYSYLPEKEQAMARWVSWLKATLAGEGEVVHLEEVRRG